MSGNTLEVDYPRLSPAMEENQPLLEDADEGKQEVDTQLLANPEEIRRTPTPPRGVSVLFLNPESMPPSAIHLNIGQPSAIRRRLDALTSSMSTKTRNHISDVGRGCLIVIASPFLIVALAFYTIGTILEGVAMVLKGVSVVGGNFVVRRHGTQSPSVMPAEWV